MQAPTYADGKSLEVIMLMYVDFFKNTINKIWRCKRARRLQNLVCVFCDRLENVWPFLKNLFISLKNIIVFFFSPGYDTKWGLNT